MLPQQAVRHQRENNHAFADEDAFAEAEEVFFALLVEEDFLVLLAEEAFLVLLDDDFPTTLAPLLVAPAPLPLLLDFVDVDFMVVVGLVDDVVGLLDVLVDFTELLLFTELLPLLDVLPAAFELLVDLAAVLLAEAEAAPSTTPSTQ